MITRRGLVDLLGRTGSETQKRTSCQLEVMGDDRGLNGICYFSRQVILPLRLYDRMTQTKLGALNLL